MRYIGKAATLVLLLFLAAGLPELPNLQSEGPAESKSEEKTEVAVDLMECTTMALCKGGSGTPMPRTIDPRSPKSPKSDWTRSPKSEQSMQNGFGGPLVI